VAGAVPRAGSRARGMSGRLGPGRARCGPARWHPL